MLHRLSAVVAGGLPVRRVLQSRRHLGGSHDHSHGGQQITPRFLNLEPGRKIEAWEAITWVTFGLSFIMTVAFLNFGPDTTLTSWARNEAIVRQKLRAEGVCMLFSHLACLCCF